MTTIIKTLSRSSSMSPLQLPPGLQRPSSFKGKYHSIAHSFVPPDMMQKHPKPNTRFWRDTDPKQLWKIASTSHALIALQTEAGKLLRKATIACTTVTAARPSMTRWRNPANALFPRQHKRWSCERNTVIRKIQKRTFVLFIPSRLLTIIRTRISNEEPTWNGSPSIPITVISQSMIHSVEILMAHVWHEINQKANNVTGSRLLSGCTIRQGRGEISAFTSLFESGITMMHGLRKTSIHKKRVAIAWIWWIG